MIFKCSSDRKCNKKNQASGNCSSSQVLNNFMTLFLALIFLSGCASPFHQKSAQGSNTLLPIIADREAGSQRLTDSSPVPSLKGVDWTKIVTAKELGCLPPTSPGDPYGVRVDAKQFADVTGDGNAEAFVAVACIGSTESWPDRLEVFDGASAPVHPQRLATLLDYQDGTDGPHGLGLRIQSIKVAGKQVVVVSKGWLPGECFACGDRQVTDTFSWNGSSFTHGSRSLAQIQRKI